MPPHVIHWDDVEPRRNERGYLGATWRNLGVAAGTVTVGLKYLELAPGEIPTPAHVHLDEEEIFFVLRGSGLSWQEEKTYAVRAGDCLVHRIYEEEHTLQGGPEGMELLVYGQRGKGESAVLPRSGTAWKWPGWIDVHIEGTPWDREAEIGPPAFGEPEPRPETIRNLDEVEAERGGRLKALAPRGISESTGLNWVELPPGETGAPRHCHSAEEEIFVILDGGGTLYLNDDEHPVRPGDVIARPAATRVAHGFRAGEPGLTYLAYGTREPNDIAYYPGSQRISFRGVGVIVDVARVPYPDVF